MCTDDLGMVVGRVAPTRVEMRLDTPEWEIGERDRTPSATQARIAEIVVRQARSMQSDEEPDDVLTCSIHTDVLGPNPGGPVEVVAERLPACLGGQLWTVDATTLDGRLIARSRVRLSRETDATA